MAMDVVESVVGDDGLVLRATSCVELRRAADPIDFETFRGPVRAQLGRIDVVIEHNGKWSLRPQKLKTIFSMTTIERPSTAAPRW